jgi:hypothetical protein
MTPFILGKDHSKLFRQELLGFKGTLVLLFAFFRYILNCLPDLFVAPMTKMGRSFEDDEENPSEAPDNPSSSARS